jgi:PAS domain S-box-containing protein
MGSKHNEANFEDIFHSVSEGILYTSGLGQVISVNKALVRMTGIPGEDLIGRLVTDLTRRYLSTRDAGKAVGLITDFISGKEIMPIEIEINQRIIEVSVNRNTKTNRLIGVLRDITDRKSAEAALMKSEELKRKLLGTIPDIVIRTDLQGNITFLNEHALNDYPYLTKENLITRNIFSFFEGEDLQRAIENTRLMFEKPLGVKEYILQLDGNHQISCEVNGDVIRDSDGNPTGMVYVIRDITQRKQAEMETIKSEARARHQRAAIADLVLDPLFTAGETSTALRRVAKILSEVLGVSRASVWTLTDDGTELHCQVLYEAGNDTYSSGSFLKATDFPGYFRAMMTENRVYAEDAQNDPRTSELADQYLKKLGITSMLDAGIFVEGRLTGVVCSEHTGEKRKWYPDEESFISTISALVGQLKVNAGRREAEIALTASNKRLRELSTLLRLMADNMPDMLWAKNLDREYIFANKTLCDKLLNAADTNEPLGKTDLFFALREREAHRENPGWHTFGENCRDSDTATLESLQSMQFDESGNVKGEFLFLDVHKAPLFDEHAKLIGVVGSARDVTKAKETENQLRKLSQAVEQSQVSVIITNTHGDIEYVNPKFTEVTGYSKEEALGKNSRILKSGVHDQALYRDLWETIMAGHEWKGEVQNRKKNGDLFWESASISPIKDEAGNIIHFLSVKEDITELKLRAEKIRKSEKEHRSLIMQMQEGLVAGDKNGLIRYVNPMFCKMTGYEENELIGKSGYELMLSDEDIVKMKERNENRSRILTDEYELEVTTRSGEKKMLWFHASPTVDDNGVFTGSLSTVIDITEKKQLERELKRQTHLRELLMEISSGFINIPLEQVDASVHDALRKMAMFVNADRSYTFDYDWEHQVCNNITEWCDVGISPEIGNLQKVPLHMMQDWVEAHQKGDPMYVPDVHTLPHGAVRDILEPQGIKSVLAVPMMNEGRCIGFVGFDSVKHHHNYSLTEQQLLKIFAQSLSNVRMRKQMLQDLIAAKEKAEESNRLKTAFLQNLSHEVRTPLNGIIGFADLLQEADITNEERNSYTNIVIDRGWQLTTIINDILTISLLETKQELIFNEDFNLNALLLSQVSRFKEQAAARGLSFNLSSQLSEQTADVTADKTKLGQVLSNLISNALKFTEYGGIDLGCQVKGAWLEFFVRDTGIGIDQSKLVLIFDRFTQADDDIRGTFGGAGLGLSISKGFIELMGGKIWVESEKGRGSVFFFTLPYKPSLQVKTISAMVAPGNLPSRKRTVLVAEDEEYNFLYLETLLTKLDVNVLHASNGQEAIDLCQREKVDLVLMDIKMPVINGHEAAKRIKENLPGLPIVAQTAHAVQSEISLYGDVFDDYITKPFNREKLRVIASRFIKP